MKGIRSFIFGVIFFIIAALIGCGLEKVIVLLLPSDPAGALVRVFDVGVHALSFNVNICGVAGLVISYFIVSYLLKK
jgi:hypothetical protein